MRYIPDHQEPESPHHHDSDNNPGGDHNHNLDRKRDEELKRVSDVRKEQRDKPRKSRGK